LSAICSIRRGEKFLQALVRNPECLRPLERDTGIDGKLLVISKWMGIISSNGVL
jgi:hypothetical protein